MQIQEAGKGDVTITNDGATILKRMQVLHPTAKMVKIVGYVSFVAVGFARIMQFLFASLQKLLKLCCGDSW